MSGERERFIGTWQLASQETHDAGGRVEPSRGENPRGVIMYDGAGQMAVQLMRTDAQAANFRDMGDFETAMRGYLAYFGRYEVDEDAGTVRHHVEGASYFGYRGVTLTRHYTFDGDTLTLRAASPDGSAQRVLVWQRG